ncbi:MAG: YcaO-like family protein, partial [Pseudomonadota bacterium]
MTLSNLFPDEEPKCEGDASGRTVAPSATLARFSPLMDSCGITRIANVTGLDSVGIPVALAVRPNSRSVAVSQGKGLSWPAAKASALMESIEVWHAENVQLPVFYGTARDLSARSPVVDIELLPHLPGVQRTASDPCLWVEGVELFSQSTMLVPFEMVHANYTRPIQPMHGMYPA